MGAYYVGLDVHSRETVFVIQDEAGTVVGRGTVPMTPEGMARLCRDYQLPPGTGVALETGTSAFYVARALVELHLTPVVIDAHEVRLKAHRPMQKSDRRDAFELCDGVRRDLYRSIVHIPSPAISRLRTTLSRRRHFVRIQTAEINAGKRLLRGRLTRRDANKFAECRQLGPAARRPRRRPRASDPHPLPPGRLAADGRAGPRRQPPVWATWLAVGATRFAASRRFPGSVRSSRSRPLRSSRMPNAPVSSSMGRGVAIHQAGRPRRPTGSSEIGEATLTPTNTHSSSDSTPMPSCVTRFGRRSERTRCRGQCVQHAIEKEERPWARCRLEAIARLATTESDRGSRALGTRTYTACISSTLSAMRSGSRCNASRARASDADKPHTLSPKSTGLTRPRGGSLNTLWRSSLPGHAKRPLANRYSWSRYLPARIYWSAPLTLHLPRIRTRNSSGPRAFVVSTRRPSI